MAGLAARTPPGSDECMMSPVRTAPGWRPHWIRLASWNLGYPGLERLERQVPRAPDYAGDCGGRP